jgi:hypothetical protein
VTLMGSCFPRSENPDLGTRHPVFVASQGFPKSRSFASLTPQMMNHLRGPKRAPLRMTNLEGIVEREQLQILRLPLVAQDDKFREERTCSRGASLEAFQLVAHGGCGEFLGALHQEWERDENRGDCDHDPDDIDIGEEAGLDLGHAVDLRARVVHRVRHG